MKEQIKDNILVVLWLIWDTETGIWQLFFLFYFFAKSRLNTTLGLGMYPSGRVLA